VIDNRVDGMGEDEVDDVADDVLYVDDADAAEDDDEIVSVWASMVTGAHYAFRRSFGRRGGPDGTGAG
jgi:hypothetical protein